MNDTKEISNKQAVIWLGELSIIHATGEDTGGHYSMVELYASKEGEVPLHVHHNEDEAFYIIDGEMTFYIGDKTIKAKTGDFVFGPKDVPHKYTVDSSGFTRVMMFFSPPGFEGFVRDTSFPATSMTPPSPNEIEIDYEKVTKIAAEYGAEFIENPE